MVLYIEWLHFLNLFELTVRRFDHCRTLFSVFMYLFELFFVSSKFILSEFLLDLFLNLVLLISITLVLFQGFLAAHFLTFLSLSLLFFELLDQLDVLISLDRSIVCVM